MIIKFNDKVLKVGNKWCNGDNIPPLYENPTILYPKNTSVVNSLTLSNLPPITQRYGVVSFDAKIDLPPERVEVTSVMGIECQSTNIWMCIADSHYNTIMQRWNPRISFSAASSRATEYYSLFTSFDAAENVGTTVQTFGVGANIQFNGYINDTLFTNSYINDYSSANKYTHFKFIFDRNTNTFYQYLNEIYVGHGTITSPFHQDEFLNWYTHSHPHINGGRVGTIKNVEIVSFNDFDSAAAYT